MVVHTELATLRLGKPVSRVERGTVGVDESSQNCYVRRWNWPCGCAGEIIGGSLLELNCCPEHAP